MVGRQEEESQMSNFTPGLEGVVAFETKIAEPDKEGGALRYRGVDIEELVGRVTYGQVWGLLVDNAFEPGLPPAEPYPIPVHSGDIRVDVQSALAMLAPAWGMHQLLDISDEQARDDLARASVMALSFVAQSARGTGMPMVPQRRVDEAKTITERFMIRWRGEPDPRHVKAIDAYWVSAAEHGMNASTFTARVIASTGADVAAALSGAVGAMSGPLHGGAPARVLHMIEEVERTGDADAYVKQTLDRGERLMGFGHRVYRAEDPRARVLRRTARDLGAPRYEVAAALEKAALDELHARRPDRVLATNVEFWAAIMLDFAEVPPHMFTSMFTCARTAGWAAHILEQKQTGRLVRPSARYVGPPARSVSEVPGAADVLDNDVLTPRVRSRQSSGLTRFDARQGRSGQVPIVS
jgi:citrate synthase